jgi:Carboxypeptidase regulatory-like domain
MHRGFPVKRRPITCVSFAWLLLLCAGVVPSRAQVPRDTLANIAGTVRSSINGLPISGVMVALRGLRAFSVSDSTGAFALAGLPPGPQTLRILYGDSLSYDQTVSLKRGKTLTLSVLLDMDAVALSPIVVEAKSWRADRSLAGFYERQKWGWGRFYTLADLERRRGVSVRSLLAESGVMERCRIGECVPVVLSGIHPCVLSVFVDGMKMPPDYLESLRVDELAAVEVYKHGLDVPVDFRWDAGACGAVLAWSRY